MWTSLYVQFHTQRIISLSVCFQVRCLEEQKTEARIYYCVEWKTVSLYLGRLTKDGQFHLRLRVLPFKLIIQPNKNFRLVSRNSILIFCDRGMRREHDSLEVIMQKRTRYSTASSQKPHTCLLSRRLEGALPERQVIQAHILYRGRCWSEALWVIVCLAADSLTSVTINNQHLPLI